MNLYYPDQPGFTFGLDTEDTLMLNYKYKFEKDENCNTSPQRATESIERHRAMQDILCGPPYFLCGSLWAENLHELAAGEEIIHYNIDLV